MLPDFVEEAARRLCTARGGSPVHELPSSCRPQSYADAYQIQDAVTRRLGLAPGGWKVGVASSAAAAFCAPIYASMTRPSPATYNATELRFAAGPDAAGASLAGLGDDESGAGLEELQNFGEASRGLQPLPSTLNNELGRARRFDHAVGWQLVRVAEHRKQGDSVAMVDRVISPIPASDMPAIETEELVQLGPREIHRSVPCPIVSER